MVYNMKDTEKISISIIVPIYNVEKTLRKCLLSIRNQTYKNIEIICVNDGSPDNSAKIVEEMMQEDSRIILINKESDGPSSARNAGLKIAKGDYIGFVDSDDYISHDMYQKLFDAMEKDLSDLICCGTNVVGEDDYTSLQNYLKTPDKMVPLSSLLFLNLNVYAWNKLYKKEIIDSFNIQFPEGLLYEDAAFLYMYLCHVKKVSFLSDKLYFYVQHNDSIMAQTSRNKSIKALDHIKILFPLWKHISSYSVSDKYIKVFLEISWKYIAIAFKYLSSDLKKYAFSEGKKLFQFVYGLDFSLFSSSKLRFNFFVILACIKMIFRKIQKKVWGRSV